MNETFTLTMTHRVSRWRFPPDRFVEYDESDEAWAVPLGFGSMVDELQTVEVPHCIVSSIDPDGTITMKGYLPPAIGYRRS